MIVDVDVDVPEVGRYDEGNAECLRMLINRCDSLAAVSVAYRYTHGSRG